MVQESICVGHCVGIDRVLQPATEAAMIPTLVVEGVQPALAPALGCAFPDGTMF